MHIVLYSSKAGQQNGLDLLGRTANPQKPMDQTYNTTVQSSAHYGVKDDSAKNDSARDAHETAIAHLYKGITYYLFEAEAQALKSFEEISPFIQAIAPVMV